MQNLINFFKIIIIINTTTLPFFNGDLLLNNNYQEKKFTFFFFFAAECQRWFVCVWYAESSYLHELDERQNQRPYLGYC